VSVLTSLSNPKVKEAVKLRSNPCRRQPRRFLIDGQREILRAVQSGISIVEIFTVLPPQEFGKFTISGTAVYQVTAPVLNKIAFGERNEGIVAVAEEPDCSLELFETKIAAAVSPLLAVIEKPEKPGNIGAVFRSADGAGVCGIMLADTRVHPFHANAIRSSMGTVFHVPVVSRSAADVKRWLQDRHIQIAAAWCSGTAVKYTEVDFRKPTAVVLGNEAEGLSPLWGENDVIKVTLPMSGIADSLNVSAAAGILFYEAQRQRSLR
jgi:TrmH family RNA methyltransferase